MIIICYISDQEDFHKEIIHEWIRMDVSESWKIIVWKSMED